MRFLRTPIHLSKSEFWKYCVYFAFHSGYIDSLPTNSHMPYAILFSKSCSWSKHVISFVLCYWLHHYYPAILPLPAAILYPSYLSLTHDSSVITLQLYPTFLQLSTVLPSLHLLLLIESSDPLIPINFYPPRALRGSPGHLISNIYLFTVPADHSHPLQLNGSNNATLQEPATSLYHTVSSQSPA